MKDYNEDEYKEWIKKQSFKNTIYIWLFVLISIMVSLAIFVVTSNFLLEIEIIISTINRINVDELVILFMFYLFLLLLVTIIYVVLITVSFKLYSKFEKWYSFSKNQIYELLTMIVFIATVMSILVKLTVTGDDITTLNEKVDIQTAVYLLGVFPPYIYSIFLNIREKNLEMFFRKSLQKHMKEMVKNEK